MKKILFALLALNFLSIKSQTLTQAANEPKVGDVDNETLMDTTAFTSGMPNSIKGNACTWNFTPIALTTTMLTTNYVSPSSVASSTAYSGCNIVQQDGVFYTFLKSVSSPTTQTEILGATTAFGSLTFTNTGIALKYPASYSYSLTDNIAGSFSSSLTSGTFNGNIVTSADGLGTLNLPYGISFSNVLRIKSIQTISLAAGLIPIGTVKQTLYNYYHSSQKYPILSITYQSLSLITSSTPSITSSVKGNGNVLVALKEQSRLDAGNLALYPNPVKDILNIAVNQKQEPKEIIVYNALGQVTLKQNFSTAIDLGLLGPGIYFVDVITQEGTYRKRIVRE